MKKKEDEVKMLPEHLKKSTFSRPAWYKENLENAKKNFISEVPKKISHSMVKKPVPNSQSQDLIIQMHSLDQSTYKSKFAKKYHKEKNDFRASLRNLLSLVIVN